MPDLIYYLHATVFDTKRSTTFAVELNEYLWCLLLKYKYIRKQSLAPGLINAIKVSVKALTAEGGGLFVTRYFPSPERAALFAHSNCDCTSAVHFHNS